LLFELLPGLQINEDSHSILSDLKGSGIVDVFF
jgi:hypothetical protein